MAQQTTPQPPYGFDPNQQGFTPPNPNQGYNQGYPTPPLQPNPYDPNPQVTPVYDPNANNYAASYPTVDYNDPNAYPPAPAYPSQPAYDPNTQFVPQPNYTQTDPYQNPSLDPATGGYYDPNTYPQPTAPAYDPNLGYTSPGYNYNTEPSQAYTDPNQPPAYPPAPQYNDPYANPSTYPPADPYATVQSSDPYVASYANSVVDTSPTEGFEVKKSGNRVFLIIGLAIIVVLIVATLVILLILNNQPLPNSNNTTSSSSSQSQISSSSSSVSSQSSSSSSSTSSQTSTDNTGLTTNEGTPAGEARVNKGKAPTPQWLTQYFSTNGAVDQNGNCLQVTICGEAADPDKDGLKNSEEYEYDTDPLTADTDNDGISDGNEVLVYFTHPRIKDSDRDTVFDGAEIVACTDPIKETTEKISSQRRGEIIKSLEIWKLTEPTIKTLQAGGATTTDINNGLIDANCTGITVEL